MDDNTDELDLATIELTARIEQTMGNFSYNLTRRSVDAAHEIIDRYAKLYDIQPTDLEQELAEETALREKLDGICTRTVNALKGKPPENVMWSWHDLPELATKAAADIEHWKRTAGEYLAQRNALRARFKDLEEK
jgi:hypothetical protein